MVEKLKLNAVITLFLAFIMILSAITVEGENNTPDTVFDSGETDEDSTNNIFDVLTNDSPVANDDEVTVYFNSSNNVINVLANDTDPDVGDVITLDSIDNGPSHGTADIENGKIVYTPDSGFAGSDELTYRISDDDGADDTAKVFITVNNVNDDPVAENDTAIVDENSVDDVIDVLSNDYDIDKDGLLIIFVSKPGNGTADISVDGDLIYYTPNPKYVGSDNFSYEITDGNGGFASASVEITVLEEYVNTPPVAEDDTSTVYENSTNNAIDVLSNDDDDGDSLTIVSVSEPGNGTATISVDGDLIYYTPDSGYLGSDSFTYEITDGNDGYDTATVNVSVEQIPPQIIIKPKRGYVYLRDKEMFKMGALLNFIECDLITIGQITFEVEVNESDSFVVERVEYYIDGDLANTTTGPFNWTLNEHTFGIYTVTAKAYGEGQVISDELDALIINFGFSSGENTKLRGRLRN